MEISRTQRYRKQRKRNFPAFLFMVTVVLAAAIFLIEHSSLKSKVMNTGQSTAAATANSNANSNANSSDSSSQASMHHPSVNSNGNQSLADANQIQGVPLLSQMPDLPTGCEPTSLTMLLQWAGIQVNPSDVADTLPRVNLPTDDGETSTGGDPNLGYLGNPHTNEGFGVYHQPIANLLNHYLPGQAVDLTGSDFKAVLGAVGTGRPVVAWITFELDEPTVDSTWTTDSGNTIKWLVPEHCVVVTGYTNQEIIVNNPYNGQVERYNKTLFQTRWEQMGKQAVTVKSATSKSK